MVEAVIFDLSGVIVSRINGIGKMLEPKLNLKSEEIHSRIKAEEFQDFVRGKISEEEYWSKIISKNGWETDINVLKNASRKNFREIKGTKEIIIKIREKGIRLGLLSAHTKEWVCYLREKFGYEKFFHSALYSYQVGYTKPNRKLYETILKKIGVESAQCVYIDDKEKYLRPAKELGMKTILFESPEQLEKDLDVHVDL